MRLPQSATRRSWAGIAAIGAALAAALMLVASLRSLSDIGPAVILAARSESAPATAPGSGALPGAAVPAEPAPACPEAQCPSEPARIGAAAPIARDIAATIQPADPDVWALDPQPIGPVASEARAPRRALHNTPWAVAGSVATAEEAVDDESQGGGHDE